MLDHYFLNLAHQLALQNEGMTSPNPAVGAVIVRGENLISFGSHEKAGEAHAEVIALHRAGSRARNATLYCTLEPCAHQGKTGPCVDEIVSSGISRVVYGVQDQNPLVSGKGVSALQKAGIITEQISLKAIVDFYEPLFKTFRTQRPYLIAKVAMTANGIISPADRNSRWITNEMSLSWVHQLRARCDGVLVGADTVLLDRPHLTVRTDAVRRTPVRIIIDSRLKLHPEECSLLENEGPIVICGSQTAPASKENAWKNYPVEVLRFLNVQELMRSLYDMGLRKIIVEGGQKIFTFFHVAGMIDEYVLMIAPRLLTGKHFLNFLAGPEQSLAETRRYKMEPPLEIDGDLVIRIFSEASSV
jgi:diaminohydroxyphosphoribosylaminopyrimidine deaminase/5-amino-6-(5-phosphoribosylamino)uracil reductase